MGIYDGLVANYCKDCNQYSPVSNSPFHLEVFKKFENKMNGQLDPFENDPKRILK